MSNRAGVGQHPDQGTGAPSGGAAPYAADVENRRGLALGTAAYLLWGLFPLYWPLLEPAGATEVLAHRVLWSAVTMVFIIVLARRRRALAALLADRRKVGLLTIGAVVIAVNWGTYIWAVNHDRVVEASLGYFINPLVTVLMGVLVLGERLRRLQWAAVGVALAAVLVLSVDYGHPPYVALVLACSFGTYGLAKKKADTGALESLAYETWISVPVAIAWLVWLGTRGESTFATGEWWHTALFLTTGVVTVVPLMLFSAAATRVPMVSLGLLQYIAPVVQFILGLVVFGEDMSAGRWAGFALVWLALAVFTVEALRHRRRQLKLAAEASAL